MKQRLGETLCQQGVLSHDVLNRALLIQKRFGSRLGDTLIANGMIGYLNLYKAVAAHHHLPFINLLKELPDASLLHISQANLYLEKRLIPWRRVDGKLVIATADPSEETIRWITEYFGEDTAIAVTSPFDIRRAVEQHFSTELDASSRLSLWKSAPESSARSTLLSQQKQFSLLLMLGTIAIIASAPSTSTLAILLICHIAYGITMLFKAALFSGSTYIPIQYDWSTELATLDEKTLPVYTILVPMYREAASLPCMLESMRKMDYPPCRMDIKLVLEADDKETLEAAYKLKPRYQFDIIRVPPSNPRTKPKACNYALRFARGELVTIFDADDKPERLQLKKAVIAFRNADPDVVCLQARLNYYNANDNWLTRLFSLEYTILFYYLLHGLEKLGIPIPLGGTSNHISLKRLRELGEWDPYNVTEDADLGTRLAARGLKTIMLDSYTMEEAPNQIGAWIRQRSRWIKGYMQTWLVHMRHPVRLYKTLGLRGFLGFQFFVGFSSFTFLSTPLVWLVSVWGLTHIAYLQSIPLPKWLLWLTMGNLLANILTHWYMALYCASMYRKYLWEMIGAALIYPLYLLLHSLASYKALWQLIVKPHFWEKTVHGLARHIDMKAIEGAKASSKRMPKPIKQLTAAAITG